jgi:hypothetical protein
MSGGKPEVWQFIRQHLTKFTLQDGRKEGSIHLFASYRLLLPVFLISLGLLHYSQICLKANFSAKLSEAIFSFSSLSPFPKDLNMFQMILPSVSSPNTMTLILFLSVLSPLNTNYCLGPDSSLLPSL